MSEDTLRLVARTMGMELEAFRAKYLTDAPFHALVRVYIASLRRADAPNTTPQARLGDPVAVPAPALVHSVVHWGNRDYEILGFQGVGEYLLRPRLAESRKLPAEDYSADRELFGGPGLGRRAAEPFESWDSASGSFTDPHFADEEEPSA